MNPRRWFGPTRADLRAEVALWRERCKRSDAVKQEAHARIKRMRAEVNVALSKERGRAEKAEAALRRLEQERMLSAEPARVDGCAKVRLHEKAEAERWAERIAEGTGGEAELLNTYRCKVCPRSPVTMQRYWHVGHAGSEAGQAAKAAGKRARGSATYQAERAGMTLGQRVDPRVMAQLRDIGRGRG